MTDTMTRLTLKAADEHAVSVPCRAEAWLAGACLTRAWSINGCVELDLPVSGVVQIRVCSGIAYDAVTMAFDPAVGNTSRNVVLRRRFDAKAGGWYGGDCFRHVWQPACEESRILTDDSRKGLAEGLDFRLLTPPWDAHETWLSAAAISQRCATATSEGLALGWGLETPKGPIIEPDGQSTGNAHTYGHGWAIGLSDLSAGPHFFATGPNFPVIQEIHRQGGIVGCAHPARSQLHHGILTAGCACELPFDFLSGAGYDALDVLGPATDDPATAERVWWALLNLGYRVTATANSGSSASGDVPPGRFRTYVQMTGGFSWRGLIDGIRCGACIASSGPFVLCDIDGAGPGSEFSSDGRVRRLTLQAWSGAGPNEHLVVVQIIRNGEIIQVWNLATQKLRLWQGIFEIQEKHFAWYAVRVISSAMDSDGTSSSQTAREVAIANPIYFLPPDFTRPTPAFARLQVRVTDTADREVPCKVTAWMGEKIVSVQNVPMGYTRMDMPAGARLIFESAGFAPETRSAFSDSPLSDYCRDLSLAHVAQDAAAVWREMQGLLNNIDLPVRLFRTYAFKNAALSADQKT